MGSALATYLPNLTAFLLKASLVVQMVKDPLAMQVVWI